MSGVRWQPWIAPLIAVSLAVTACAPRDQTGGETNEGVTPTGESAPTEEGPAVVEPSRGPGPFDLADTTIGLSDLDSYRAALEMRFEGTKGGKPYRWSESYTLAITRDPAASLFTYSNTGLAEDVTVTGLTQTDIGGVSYTIDWPGAPCVASIIEPESVSPVGMEPAVLLLPVYGAEEASQERVNGVAANHYTFDERAIGAEGLSTASGDLWTASEGGYVVSYVAEEEGPLDYFGDGAQGTMTWEYDLTDINQPLAIMPPEGCPPGLVDAPLADDAAHVVRIPGFLSYHTAADVGSVVAMYQEQLPEAGWQPDGEPLVGDGLASLEFTQAGQRLSIQVAAREEGTVVSLWLSMESS